MRKRLLLFFVLLSFCSVTLSAQGLETTAKKDDWEEINFEFDSSILTDGYPSLLRLSELLSQHSDYRVKLTGHTDFRGTDQYNVGLGQRRSETVRSFLTKYGASQSQIAIETQGETTPKVPNETDEGRFMNRRVTMYLTDGQGNVISDGGVGDAINGLEKLMKAQEECCDKILRKLDKLDEIVDLLNQLKRENDQLKADVADLQKRPTPAAATPAPTVAEIADAMPKPGKKFSAINLNVGPDTQDGNVSFTGSGRAFIPFAGRHAVQVQGEFLHYFGRDEGQVDLGLVNRWGNFQAGAFSSFKYVKFDEWQQAGGLGQGAVTLDYVFGKGRAGFFGTKSFVDGATVNTALLRRNVIEETYLQVVDQVGFSTAFAAWSRAWFEGNLGALFRRGGDNRPGGTIRYVHPITSHLAFTAEAGLNETFVTSSNQGRVVFGLQVGNWLNPHDYKMHGDAPVPVDVPRVRYEVLTRQIRTGNDSPVADAGPDQIGIDAGPVSLDGSGSFDPDGDPITYKWEQTGGPPVTLTGTTTATSGFTAIDGETYHFRLIVRDDQGGQGTDRVTVSTLSEDVTINSFQITPTTVRMGDPVLIEWQVSNADSVKITPQPGDVDNQGTSSVIVNQTTVFTLTARNRGREINKSITVTVLPPDPTPEVLIASFTATPQRILRGTTSVLSWNTRNATSVEIQPIGASFEAGGSATVSPTETTTYTLKAFGPDNMMKVATVTVEVFEQEIPEVQIVQFQATPTSIKRGEVSVLNWNTLNADTVEIEQLGLSFEQGGGSATVSPTETTTYILRATNAGGTKVATVTVMVVEPDQPIIVQFTAVPLSIERGEVSVLQWNTQNAESVEIEPIGGSFQTSGSTTVSPTETTTYTLRATNAVGAAVATVTIEVIQPQPPRILNFVASPQEILPGEQSTLSWEVENADRINISPAIGDVDLTGTSTVSPAGTTTYVLTAENQVGAVVATATVTVGTPVRIVNFTANKTVVQKPGDPAVLTWVTENAVRVVITGIGDVQPNGSRTVNPTAITTYTLIAYGKNTEATAVLILKVENENRSPIAIAEAPVAILVPAGTQTGRGQLDGSNSYDPDGDPITFGWRVIGNLNARVINPSAAKPTVEFLGGFGGYEFELMVTDDKGLMGLDRVKVFWVDP